MLEGLDLIKRPARNNAILIISVFVMIIAVSLIMFTDLVTFSTPEIDQVKLYLSTFIGLAIVFAVLFHFRQPDSWTAETRNLGFGNFLRLSFGSLWILDGILQLQPEMSYGFISNVVTPVINGLPAFLQPYLSPITIIWAAHPVLFDSISAIIQIAIGSGMLIFNKGHRLDAVLIISITWGIVVWTIGEGFGGTILPGASYLTGFPGSAIVYVLVSVVLILRIGQPSKTRIISLFIAIIFSLSALEQALPSNGFWYRGAISSIPGGMASNVQPVQLQSMLYWFSSVFSSTFMTWNSVFVALFLAIAIFWSLDSKYAPYLTILASILIWVVFQDFGVIGGYGTDPNTALPMILLSLSVIISRHSSSANFAPVGNKNTILQ
jgi:hypothetical protein